MIGIPFHTQVGCYKLTVYYKCPSVMYTEPSPTPVVICESKLKTYIIIWMPFGKSSCKFTQDLKASFQG